MISEKHDTNIITYWLREWLRSGARIPKEVVTDYSLALLNGVCLAFNEKSLQAYISACYTSLQDHKIPEMLPCYVRVDVAHLIKLVSRWDCFQGKHGRVKDFYIRCVALMTTCSDKVTFEELMFSVFVVAFSECDGTDDLGKETECQHHQTVLLNKIRSFEVEISDTENQYYNEDISNNEVYVEGDIASNIDEIRIAGERTANEAQSSGRFNPYYLPGIVESLTRIGRHFPIWTNVMTEKFASLKNVATSARSEAYFNDLKHTILGDDARPLRHDKFLIKHIRSITSDCKLHRAAFDRNENQYDDKTVNILSMSEEGCNEPKNDLSGISFLGEEENWKGRNTSSVECIENKGKHKLEREYLISNADAGQNINIEVTNKRNNENEHCNEIKRKIGKDDKKENKLFNKPESSLKRGRYLQACPDINLIHSRPLRRTKNAVIQNGSILPPIKVGSLKMELMNTCPFDTIVEILSTAYLDSSIYKASVDKNLANFTFFQIVADYVKIV